MAPPPLADLHRASLLFAALTWRRRRASSDAACSSRRTAAAYDTASRPPIFNVPSPTSRAGIEPADPPIKEPPPDPPEASPGRGEPQPDSITDIAPDEERSTRDASRAGFRPCCPPRSALLGAGGRGARASARARSRWRRRRPRRPPRSPPRRKSDLRGQFPRVELIFLPHHCSKASSSPGSTRGSSHRRRASPPALQSRHSPSSINMPTSLASRMSD